MAKIGNKPFQVPSNVSFSFAQGIGEVVVKGPKGTLSQAIEPGVSFMRKEDQVYVMIATQQKRHKALQGLYRALLYNMVVGVSEGFKQRLELIGIGYKVALRKPNLFEFNLGYASPIYFLLPKEVKATIVDGAKSPTLELESHDKQLLGQLIAKLRSLRLPEPYKGKGIRKPEEHVRRKVGKAAGK